MPQHLLGPLQSTIQTPVCIHISPTAPFLYILLCAPFFFYILPQPISFLLQPAAGMYLLSPTVICAHTHTHTHIHTHTHTGISNSTRHLHRHSSASSSRNSSIKRPEVEAGRHTQPTAGMRSQRCKNGCKSVCTICN